MEMKGTREGLLAETGMCSGMAEIIQLNTEVSKCFEEAVVKVNAVE